MHPTAAKGFVTPDVYERGRPDYPAAAIDAMGLTQDMRVVDLGCGTGKLTAALYARGIDVIGIEPLPGMLDTLHERVPDVRVCGGLAEALPVRDGTLDVIVCASAFHWFDHGAALPEIARALRPDGALQILWNRRDRLEGWASGFWEITERHRGDTPGYRSGEWHRAIELSGLFSAVTEQHFEHVQHTDVDGLIARVASISFIETLPQDEKQAVLDEARHFIATHPQTKGHETFELPYRTALYAATRLS